MFSSPSTAHFLNLIIRGDFKLTRIESIKYLLFSDSEPDLTDTAIQSLITSFGYNGAIRFIATAQYVKTSQEFSSIDDGANKFTFQNKLSGLEKLIKLAESYSLPDPESTEDGQLPRSTSLSLDTVKKDDYWSNY